MKITSFSGVLDNFINLCHRKELESAVNALKSLGNHKIHADPVVYVDFLKLCIQCGAIEHGKLLHHHIFSYGSAPPLFLVNTLLGMYVKFGMVEDARYLFAEMQIRDVVSWTTMITAYSSSGHGKEALVLLTKMNQENVRPNKYTFSSVLKGCESSMTVMELHGHIISHGLQGDLFVCSALIDTYSKCSNLDAGYSVFREMETADLVVWNSIIGAFAQDGESERALHLFKEMRESVFSASQGTLTSAFRACTCSVLLELGRQLHAQVVKFSRDLILDNAVLDMYCKCGSLEEANLAFGRMKERDVITWSTMITGLSQNGQSREAMVLFKSMQLSGHKPNYITLVGVLFACSHAGLLGDGWYYFKSMKNLYGIEPGKEHFGCMIDLLGRAGKVEEAFQFIQEIQDKLDPSIWRALLNACRIHKNVKLAKLAVKKILDMDPADKGAYVTLSNVYAASHMWNSAENVRRFMRVKGVKKDPGCSWIEVDRQVHVFIGGDTLHPLMDCITVKLNKLINRISEVGYIPDPACALQDLEEEQRECAVRYHSEKLAVAFGLMKSLHGRPIRIVKNLRTCRDCHSFTKFVSQITHQYIVIRDPVRFHHFRGGSCSCEDYW